MKRSILALTLVIVIIAVVAVSAYAYMANATPYNGTIHAAGIDYALYGFPTVLASQMVTPGTPATISAGSYMISIPADTFSTPVNFELLSGDTASFAAYEPSGSKPVLAFAFRVTDIRTGQLVGTFNNAVTVDVRDSGITADSQYYNIDTSGIYTLNTAGIQVTDGELMHPEDTALAGWVITSPTTQTQTQQSQVPDYTNYRFVEVLSSTTVTPGTPVTISSGPYMISIPANAFSDTVKFDLLTGDPMAFQFSLPSGEQAVADFAFRVTDLSTGQLVGTFNAPVTVDIRDSSITKDSRYYNAGTTGGLTLNSASMTLSDGELVHGANGAVVGWVITTPIAELSHVQAQQMMSSGAPDYTMFGFPTVLATRTVYPGSVYTISIGPYTVNIPSDAFSDPVQFDLLTGNTGTFMANAPAGVTPNFAFAFRVTDLKTGKLIGTFNDAVSVEIYSSDITQTSAYYNIDVNGAYTLNTAPMQLTQGDLIHTENSALVGWVVAQNLYTSGGGTMGYSNGGSSSSSSSGYYYGGGGY